MSHHATLLKQHQEAILADWTGKLEARASRLNQVTTREERMKLSRELLDGIVEAAQKGELTDVEGAHFERVRKRRKILVKATRADAILTREGIVRKPVLMLAFDDLLVEPLDVSQRFDQRTGFVDYRLFNGNVHALFVLVGKK